MKKSILAVVILLLSIASLPSIGNSFISEHIDDRMVELESYGLELKEDASESSYLHTTRHFEFTLKDSQKFLKELQNYSAKQIPPYVQAMFREVVIGADIKYSNLPFAKAFEIEIYPLKFSKKFNENLKAKDIDFYNAMSKFLSSKGILYRIEYNLLNDEFKGSIKDIQEEYKLKDETAIKLLIKSAKFKGEGSLLAPTELSSKIQKINFEVVRDKEQVSFSLEGFKSSSNFESVNTYLTSIEMKNIFMKIQGTQNDVNLSMDMFKVNASSNEQESKVQLHSKISLKHFEVSSKETKFALNGFHSSMGLSGLDKEEYLNLSKLMSQDNLQSTPSTNQALQFGLMRLIAKGLLLEIADFSLDEFSIDSQKNIEGFTSQLTLNVEESQAMNMKSIGLKSTIRISKEMYIKLQEQSGLMTRLKGYEKEDGDAYIFVLDFHDAKASINGKSIN